MDTGKLQRIIDFVIEAHSHKRSEEQVRRWDGETPYSVHPIWCAMTILHETQLPDEIRNDGAVALAFHDVDEDTVAGIPSWVGDNSRQYIKGMTFTSAVGSTEIEKGEIWNRPPVIRLLKLYDKVSNLLDGSWMPDKKWNDQYVPYVLKLANDAERNFGNLDIVKIARAIAKRR